MFETGKLIVARETWDGFLWAARPVQVVHDDSDRLVTWCPAGSVGCFATSRFVPGREHLPREERQLVSLETRRWHYRGVPARGSSLTFLREGSWASVAATWHADGRFVHWYVNFQLPFRRWSRGYDTLDLVLDIVVEPDWSWAWKDRAPFESAIRRGIFDPSIADAVEEEADRVQHDIAARSGWFDASWMEWSPSPGLQPARLPDDFAAGAAVPPGATITLDPEPVIGC